MSGTTRDQVVYGLKSAVAHLMYWTGILFLWKVAVLRRRAVVLTYHRVLSDAEAADTWSHPAIIVRRSTFDRQMQALRRHFRLLTADAFQAAMTSGAPFATASCLVTFDDGWRDTYQEAWPILERHRVPAVVFLPTRFIGTNETFWQERMGALLEAIWNRARREPDFRRAAEAALRGTPLDLIDVAADELRRTIMDRLRQLKADPSAGIPEMEARLTALLGSAVEAAATDRMMTWDEVREMARRGVSFGGHSHTHRILTHLPPEEVEDEVVRSRQAITSALGVAPSTFSYPNGNWSERVAERVAAAHTIAFSMDRGPVSCNDPRYTIKRVNIHEDVTQSVPMFLARVVGVF